MDEVGEKYFLERLLPSLEVHPRFVNGFGDDSSVIDQGTDVDVVTKIDRAATPMATVRGWADWHMWGRLAATATCSDLLATNAVPAGLMLAAILPGDFLCESAEQVVRGFAAECAEHDVAFVGGDTKQGDSRELISSGFGLVRKGAARGRRGARPGDYLVVAGELGGYLGAYIAMAEDEFAADPRGESWRLKLDYISRPVARWAEAAVMRSEPIAIAAMDTSDGIYDAVSVLSGAHGVILEESQLPFHEFARTTASAYDLPLISLGMGVGDWNIVYVVPRANANILDGLSRGAGVALTVIGEVSSSVDGVMVRDTRGRLRKLKRVVNEHFVSRQEDASEFMDLVRESPYCD